MREDNSAIMDFVPGFVLVALIIGTLSGTFSAIMDFVPGSVLVVLLIGTLSKTSISKSNL